MSRHPRGAYLRRFAADYVRPVAPGLAVAELCMGVVALSTAAQAQLVEPLVNHVFVERRADLLWPIAGAIVLAFLLKAAAQVGQSALIASATARVLARSRGDLFGRIVRADLAWFGGAPPGDLLSRLMHDAAALQAAFVAALVGIGRHALTLLFLLGVMLYQDWRLTLAAVLVYPLAIAPLVRIGRRVRRIARARHAAVAAVTERVSESFSSVRLVKAHGTEGAEIERVERALEAVRRETVRGELAVLLRHPLMELLGGLAVGAVLVYAGGEVIAGERSAGSLFAFLTALLLAYEPVKGLARLNLTLQEGRAAAERVYAALDVEPTIVDAADAAPLEIRGGEVRLAGVTFGYGDAPPVLEDVSLVVPGGSTVALVGANGAGKSTVLDLVARLYEPDAGTVEIDGQDLRTVTLASVRGAVCLVTQEVLLLDDTLRANIAYARPGADDADVARAVELAGLAELVIELPDGLETRVGPRGMRLSGGERQRVAIARAALCDAPVLLLDEASASLDAAAERALRWLTEGRTAIVVAHRLAAVLEADRIYVLAAGRIVEAGTHTELVARGGTYATTLGGAASRGVRGASS